MVCNKMWLKMEIVIVDVQINVICCTKDGPTGITYSK